MAFKLASSLALVAKAGINANTKVTTSGALLQQFSEEAEAFTNLYTKYNWTNAPSSLFAATSAALQEAVSCLGGIEIARHDQTSYQVGEVENLINVLNYKAFRILDLLKEDSFRKFVIDGSTGAE